MSCVPVARQRTLAIAVCVAAIACQGGEPSAPVRAAPSATSSSRSGTHRESESRREASEGSASPRPISCLRRSAATSSGRFGPAGGILIVGDSRLIIPGGALRDTVTITATMAGDTTSTVSFRPEGLHFRKAAGLRLSSAGCAVPREGDARIVYLAGDGTILETIPAYYDPHWKTVAAPITHFSGYAIAF